MNPRGILAVLPCLLLGAGLQPTADEVKAAYVYNFAKFVEWPDRSFPSPEAPIIVGVAGNSPMGPLLETALKSRKAGMHLFEVRRGPALVDPGACHILVAPAGDAGALQALLAPLTKKPVLTVGEAEEFIGAGGMIRFFQEEGKVRFEICPQTAEQAGLKISSKLLKVAKVVKP